MTLDAELRAEIRAELEKLKKTLHEQRQPEKPLTEADRAELRQMYERHMEAVAMLEAWRQRAKPRKPLGDTSDTVA